MKKLLLITACLILMGCVQKADEERKVTTFNPEQTARNFREILRRLAN